MPKAKFTTEHSAPSFAKPASATLDVKADRSIRLDRPDTERLDGKMRKRGRPAKMESKAPRLSSLLDRRIKTRRASGTGGGFAGDLRQQAVVKIHYFSHAGGGGGGLAGHATYVSRDGAARPDDLAQGAADERAQERGSAGHADYLTRDGAAGRDLFYTATQDRIDGRAIAADWADSDKRHFRIVLTAEEGGALKDLPGYTREVMARAEATLGKPLAWLAIDHWDTDNPHTHIILRGRDRLGRDLILPRDFVKHGLRGIARDVATERLGARTPAQARDALDRETRRHAPTRLDRLIADQLPKTGVIRIADLAAPNRDPALTQALKARAKELERLGLAKPVRRNVLAFSANWQDRLKAMELHLDVAKRMAQARQVQSLTQMLGLGKGGGKER
jgi:type IV secretory pathway VirD2 relaxase